jgi:hypothetical protein
LGYKIFIQGNATRKLPVKLSKISKNIISFLLLFLYSGGVCTSGMGEDGGKL